MAGMYVLYTLDMRRHSAKAVVSSHPVPGKRKRGKERRETETECMHVAKKRKANSHS